LVETGYCFEEREVGRGIPQKSQIRIPKARDIKIRGLIRGLSLTYLLIGDRSFASLF